MTGGDHAGPVSAPARTAAVGMVAPIGVVGVGIDAVDLDRFGRVLGRRPAVADRLFTGGELTYARAAADPVPRLSTRFAAKEAVMKALGVGLGAFPFHDVEVVRVGLDAPELVVRGEAAALAQVAGVTRWHLSLSHTDLVAVALVVAEAGPAGPAGAAGAAGATGSAGGTGSADLPATP